MTGQNITEIGWGIIGAGVIVIMGAAVHAFFPDLIPEILNGMKSQLLGIFKK
ncbi:hypothetical protein MH138_04355 [Bacillus safensis]|uniref:hypothetical protein n=1 Tax=Bacillus TaxID=1386 RepID=UPI0006A80873|nr:MULTISPECIES: hypothetical protein [Bacillus]MCY7585269.1 hypothetical protein [Bacillus safensis]MCY7586772.1 hypothetical protein [Bacillus safensis]MCY7610556.1 hypothetical protein [Bacillus safensis]MDG4729022.1 hypothetical protein [Bacillus pumilus]MDR7250838.1 hypothetical protein [Bacillus pumilus]